jgi:Uma2 family endonuclease
MTTESINSRKAETVLDHTLTGEEFFELGDIGPCELVDGTVVTMTPTGAAHGKIEVRLARLLDEYAEKKGIGWVLSGEVGIVTKRNPDRVRGADLVFLSRQQVSSIPNGFLTIAPELVVEIVSPNDRWTDIREKIDEYFAIGVKQVWIVEPPSRQLLVYKSPTEAVGYRSGNKLSAVHSLSGLEIEVDRIFT